MAAARLVCAVVGFNPGFNIFPSSRFSANLPKFFSPLWEGGKYTEILFWQTHVLHPTFAEKEKENQIMALEGEAMARLHFADSFLHPPILPCNPPISTPAVDYSPAGRSFGFRAKNATFQITVV